MHLKLCKISLKKYLKLITHFGAGSATRTAAYLAGVHSKKEIRFFHNLRYTITLKKQKRAA